MELFEMDPYINPIKASYSASIADALARYKNGEPVLFYTWTPNWTVFNFKPGEDVMWLNVPSGGPEDPATIASGVPGAVSDPINFGFAANDIAVVANKEFLAENPAAAKMFELMSVPLVDISTQNNKMHEGEDKQKDIERHVDEWIAQNQVQWDAWIAEAVTAAK
jgi:glycine betaine/proline transport system substrate-binding protein